MSEWQVVVLDCPYQSWSCTDTQHLFGSIVDLKLRAYRNVYGDGVLPADTYDYIATHLIICEQSDGRLKPVMGFKTVSLERCDRFRLPMPIYNLLASAGAAPHGSAVDAILARCRTSGVGIAYDSSFAIAPEVRASRERLLLHELFIAMIVHWHQSQNQTEQLGCGVPHVRTERLFEKIGYRRVDWDGTPLPPFPQSSLLDEDVVLLHLKGYSERALSIAVQHENSWANRLVL